MAIGSSDGSIRFYNSENLLTSATTVYDRIPRPIATLAISPDSSTVVVTTDFGTCWVVDANVSVGFTLDWQQAVAQIGTISEKIFSSWTLHPSLKPGPSLQLLSHGYVATAGGRC